MTATTKTAALNLRDDMHVHSTFSDDGHASVTENLNVAMQRGLRTIACVDHVRRDTAWVPEFAREVRRIASEREMNGLETLVGIEAKILDERGTLDAPSHVAGVDVVLIADHQFPFGAKCYSPKEIRTMLAEGSVSKAALVSALVGATRNAMEQHERAILAHLFSILPKVGLSERDVSDAQLEDLGAVARQRGTAIEVSEKWRCPSTRALVIFADAGVHLVASTDAHHAHEVGHYDSYVAAINVELEARHART